MKSGNEPDVIDREVGQRVRERRVALGLTQGALAEALGVTFQQVQKYERGANRISASRLYRLAQFLNVPPTHFFGNEANGASPPDVVSELLASTDGTRLLAAFKSISDFKVRRRIAALVEELANRQR
jgi:transcriptional regulator with XRE-family HTH domain